MKKSRPAVYVVGIGDDGCNSLSARAFSAIAKADILAGGERHLAFFQDFKGRKIVLKKNITQAIDEILEASYENTVTVLASGDPLFFGIGGLVAKKVGQEFTEIIPSPSSVQWAFAKLGLKWDDATIISLHGKPISGLKTKLKRCRKAAILTDEENSPARIAMLLEENTWTCHVLEHLGGPNERMRSMSSCELAAMSDIAPLNILVLERLDDGWREPPYIGYLREEEFAKRMPKAGLITKREVRLISLAELSLPPDGVMWDIGAGSGSVAIEAALLMPKGRAFAIECDPEGVEICEENVRAHGIDNVTVLSGRAPEALENLPPPNSVFIGGSKGSMEPIIKASLNALKPGGKLVVNAVTLDNVAETYQIFKALGLKPDLVVLNAARGVPLANKYLRYESLNPIHIFSVTKGVEP